MIFDMDGASIMLLRPQAMDTDIHATYSTSPRFSGGAEEQRKKRTEEKKSIKLGK